MSIISGTFLLFVCLLILFYYLVPRRMQWQVLLAASLIFYGCTGLKNMVYVLITAFSTYLGTRLMQRLSDRQDAYLKENKASLTRENKNAYKEQMKKRRRRILCAVLILNFGMLCMFKYFHFALAQLNGLLSALGTGVEIRDPFRLLIPLGISFYTFQTMGYLIDIYWNKYRAEENFFKVLLFVSFFPQVTQGPISDFRQLTGQLYAEHAFTYENYVSGGRRMLWGFFKKMAIADVLAFSVSKVFANYASYSGLTVLMGAFLYSIQIYADFSGYMDIMCGICRMMDIRLTENFRQPYFSRSVAEYWRRWHISLGNWFKTYLYYPLAVAKWNQNLGRKCQKCFGKRLGKSLPAFIALGIVWLTTGLWHGASWAYIAWGGLNGLIIMTSMWMAPYYAKAVKRLHINEQGWAWRTFQVVRTFLVVMFVEVLPEVGTLSQGLGFWKQIFTNHTLPQSLYELFPAAAQNQRFFYIFPWGVLLLFAVSVIQEKHPIEETLNRMPFLVREGLFAVIFLLTICFGLNLVQGGGFMYARF